MTRLRPFAAVVSLAFLGCAGLQRSPDISEPRPLATATRVEGAAPATTTTPLSSLVAPSSAAAQPAPTWTAIYARYLGPNTDGSCARAQACHAATMTDSASAYAWLAGRGYIAGRDSPLVSQTNSCLRWFGGNMPPRATPNDAAVRDLTAWVAAGANND